MTFQEGADILQKGGMLVGAFFVIWALATRRVVTRGEFDRLDQRSQDIETKLEGQLREVQTKLEGQLREANAELMKQSTTNARLVEMTLLQRQEAETVRRGSRTRQEVQDERPE